MSAHRLEDLGAYLDGELSSADQEATDLHLRGCESCRAELERQRALAHALAGLPSIGPSPQFEARFWARLAREADAAPSARARLASWISPRRLAFSLGGVAMAAAALVLLVRTDSVSGPGLPPDADWEVVADAESYELFTEDLELLELLEILEAWDGVDET